MESGENEVHTQKCEEDGQKPYNGHDGRLPPPPPHGQTLVKQAA